MAKKQKKIVANDGVERPIEDILAANSYRDTLLDRADGYLDGYFWHGCVIVEAYLAGLDAGRKGPPMPTDLTKRKRRKRMKASDETKRPIEDVVAANAYRDTLINRADGGFDWGCPWWHGWVIVEAYLAGLDAGRKEPPHADD